MKKLSFIGKLFLIGISLLLGLFLIEIGFRIILPKKQVSFARDFVIADKNTGQTIHKPNQNITVFSGEGQKDVHILTNSEGFPGKDYAVEKPNDITRIAVVGDSYVAALQVDTEKNFVSLLEKNLNASGKKSEVMNFGVGGQGTFEELRRYESYIKKYNPDYVILLFYPNDFENNQYYLSYKEKVKNYEPLWDIPLSEGNNKAGRSDWKAWLMEYSYTIPYIDARVRQNAFLSKLAIKIGLQDQGTLGAPRNGIHPTFFIFKEPLETAFTEVYDFTIDLLTYFDKYTKENDSKLIVIYLPQADQVDPILWEEKNKTVPELKNYTWNLNQPNEYLKQKLSEKNIAFLDLTPKFKKSYKENPDGFLYNGRTGHLNEQGHEFLSKILLDFSISN